MFAMRFSLKNNSKFDIMMTVIVMLYEIHERRMVVNKAPVGNFPLHTHRNVKIVTCVEGEYIVNCNGTERVMKKGDVLVMLPYDICSFTKTTGEECVTIIFPPDISEKMMTLVNEAESNNFVYSEEATDISLEMLKWKKPEDYIVLYGYVHVLMGMLTKKGEKAHRAETSFGTAIKYVSDHYREKITLESVAKKVGVSHEHLSRLFSEKIKGGFHRYIQLLRVDYAKRLLENSDLSIGEIMTESGFCDQRTFNRVFKSFTTFTPRQYRNERFEK